MKTIRTRQWFRSVALGCAMAAGTTAFGENYSYIWTNGGGDSLYANPDNWAAADEAGQQHRWFGPSSIPENATEVEVKFGNSIYQEYDTDGETPKNREIHVNTGSDVPVVFTAEEGGGANAGTLNVGTFNLPGGILDLRSGTYHFYNDIDVAYDSGCTGTLKISGADVSCEYWAYTGRSSGSGNIEVSAGSLTTGFRADGTGNGNLLLSEDGGTGSLKVSGTGEVTVNGTLGVPNSSGNGSVLVEGGKLTVNGTVSVATGNGSSGTFTVSGGETVLTRLAVGHGTGTINITGGNIKVNEDLKLSSSDEGSSGSGTLNLDGGTLTVRNFDPGVGTATINMNGGTLKPIFGGGYIDSTTVNLVINGGTIDTAGCTLTPTVTVTGFGTLTKAGDGTLNLTNADLSNFRGKINVTEGSLVVGETTYEASAVFDHTGYVWTGAEDNVWSNVNNWLLNGEVPDAAPAADSIVLIPEGDGELEIKVSGADDHTGYLTINRNVKFVRSVNNSATWGISISKVDGTGTLTLAGNKRSTPLLYDYFHIYAGTATEGELVIDTNLNVTGPIVLENQTPLRVNGTFSGDAEITCYSSNGQQGWHFYGDTSGFTGSYTGGMRASGSRDGTEFHGSALGSASASWKFGSELSKNSGYSPFKAGDGVTYKFGQLTTIFDGYSRLTFETYHKSSNSDYASNVTLEIGGKANSTSEVGGAIDGTNNKIVKVGETSTLNLTLTANTGTVEAQAGTTVLNGTVAPASLVFTGTGATVKIANTVGTYEEVVVTEDDPETTEVNEEVKDTQFTPYAGPGLSAELANCQIAADTTTEEGYTIYTLAKVATAGETQYYTVADAIAALAEVEDKTVTLVRDTTEAVVIPAVGYKLVAGEFAHGAVSGAAGVAVSEEDGVFTGVANTAATWTNAGGDNRWLNPLNWSTKSVPVAETTITLPDGAVLYTDTTALLGTPVAAIVVDGAATLTRDATASDYTAVGVVGNVTGEGTLTLKRCGLNGWGAATEINCNLAFENTTAAYALTGYDSYLQNGSFTVNGNTTGFGLLRLYAPTVFNGSVTLNDGTISGREGNNMPTFNGAVTLTGKSYIATYATAYNGAVSIGPEARLALGSSTQNYGEGFSLTGTGTIIGDTQMPSGKMLEDINDETKWQGTLEALNVSLSAAQWFGSWGNPSSTVRANKLSMPLYGNSANTGDHNIKALEVVNDGLSVSGTYSNTQDFVLPFDISGSGKMYFEMKGSGIKNVVFTGDVSNFTGMFHYPNSTTANTRFVFGSTEREFENKSVVVGEGKTVTVGTAWTAPGNVYVDGTLTIAAAKPFNYGTVFGAGKVVATTLPTTAITFGEGWAGEFVVKADGVWRIPAYGSKVVFGSDVSGLFANGDGNGPATAGAAIRLDANVTVNNGWASTTMWPENTTKITGLSGNGNLAFNWATGVEGGMAYYEIASVSDYSGTISVGNTKSAVKIDGVDVESVPLDGSRIVSLGTSNMTQFFNADAVALSATDSAGFVNVTVEGQPDEAKLFLGTDGLYVAAAKVGDDYYASYAAAAAAAVAATQEGDTPSFTVVYGNGVLNGWDYDSEAGTLTKNDGAIARVGTKNFDSLADAFDEATANDAVVLFGTSAEDVELDNEGAMLELDATSTYTGTLSGDGTVVADKDITPTFNNWTGTFVMNWDTSAATSGTAWKLDQYGVSGSTVDIAQPLPAGYLNKVASAGAPTIAPAVYLEADVSINNGFAGSNQTTTFAELGADEGVKLSFRYLANAQEKDKTYYTITKLKNFDGTLVLNPYNQVVVNAVELDATPAVGTKVVNATVDPTASLTGKIDANRPLVAKADGLYFDPVAQVGDVYYNTATEAIDAASGAVVSLVKSADSETYTLSADETVKVQYNGFGGVTVTAPEGAYVFTQTWDDETTTGTYTCRAAAASASIGGVVTYYTQVQLAYNEVNANGTVGDSFTVLDGSDGAELPGFSYNAETHTYTKVATVAQFTYGVQTHSYPTLAAACAAAEEYDPIPTVVLLVDRNSLNETTPEGWTYNAPGDGETGFGTLTKIVSSDIVVDTDGCNFKVDAATAAAITAATGVATDSDNFGKAAIAYVVGGELDEVTGEVVIPTPTITVDGSVVTVVYSGDNPHVGDYTVTCTLWSFALADANNKDNWTPVATGGIGDDLVDNGATGASKFYKVTVTVTNSQLGNETDSGEGA